MGEDFPVASAPTRREKAIVFFSKTIRNRMHNGPLHTVLGDKARVSKEPGAGKAKGFDPFGDLPTYSQKYKRPLRELPLFNTRTYPLKHFPEELQRVVFGSKKVARKSKQPKLRTRALHRVQDQGEEGQEDNEDQRIEEVQEESGDRGEGVDGDDAEPDPDETFEDDEDEMAGDYNAEGYFSGGEGEYEGDGADFGGDDDGGGGDFD